jgi:hypothetical protein
MHFLMQALSEESSSLIMSSPFSIARFVFTLTLPPVFGFLPLYASYSRTENLPNPLISILSSFFRVSVKHFRIWLMTSVACFSVSYSFLARALMRSDFSMIFVSVSYIILIFINDMTMLIDMSIEIEFQAILWTMTAVINSRMLRWQLFPLSCPTDWFLNVERSSLPNTKRAVEWSVQIIECWLECANARQPFFSWDSSHFSSIWALTW